VSILDRILLVLMSLCGLVSGVVAIMLGTGSSFVDVTTLSSAPFDGYLIVGGIIAILIAIRFFFYRVRRGAPSTDYVSLNGDHGSIRISHETIRQLANRSGKTIRGVQEFDTRIRSGEQGIVLITRVRVLPDIELAKMSADIQNSLKEYVERTTGIDVTEVVVHVAEVAASSQTKSGKVWVE
jgi:uncharacterized alkaline shock family protein YloU